MLTESAVVAVVVVVVVVVFVVVVVVVVVVVDVVVVVVVVMLAMAVASAMAGALSCGSERISCTPSEDMLKSLIIPLNLCFRDPHAFQHPIYPGVMQTQRAAQKGLVSSRVPLTIKETVLEARS